MIGSFLTRGLVMVFGYAYPAYECYKTVERYTPEIEQLRFWCQYWILVAVLTICERVGDAFVSWVPMYSEAKLAFFIYLWYPKTKGATYVYDSFFRPYIAKHENDIDQNLLEMRTRAGDMLILYWQRAASYGQTRVFGILQFIAAQSTPRPRTQEPQDGTRARQPTPLTRQPSTPGRQRAAAQLETVEPPSPSSNTSSSQQPMEESQDGTRARQPSTPSRQRAAAQMETVEPPSPSSSTSSSQQPMEVGEAIPPKAPETASAPSEAPNGQITRALSESSAGLSAPSEPKAMLPDASSSGNENADPKAKETLMEDTMRVTRAKLRKTRSGGNR